MGKLNIIKFREAIAHKDLKYIFCTGEHIHQHDIYKLRVKTEDNNVSAYYLKINRINLTYHWFYCWDIGSFHFPLTFEELFEIMPEEVKEEFLFNLDIFNGKS